MKITRWAMDRVGEHRPGAGAMVQANVQRLVDTLAALRGSGDGQVFGMAVDRVEPEGRDALIHAVCDVLVEWKAHFDGAGDQVSALALDGVGAAYGIAALRGRGRGPLGDRGRAYATAPFSAV